MCLSGIEFIKEWLTLHLYGSWANNYCPGGGHIATLLKTVKKKEFHDPEIGTGDNENAIETLFFAI